MGLLDAIGTGFEMAAPVAAKSAEAYLQSQIDEAKQSRLMEMQSKIRTDEAAADRTRIADTVGGVSRTKKVEVADESGGHTGEQRKSEPEYAREVGDALTQKGLITDAGKFYDRADRHEDKTELRTTQAAKQKSDDEKWHATNTELIRHHESLEAKAAAQLGLKAQEEKDFEATVDSYIENKAQYESLRASTKKEDQYLLDAAKQGMEADALKLKQFRVDVGDQSDLAKHMSLSATLTAMNKMIETKTMAGEDVIQDKKDRDAVARQIGKIATGNKDSGDAKPDDYADAKAALATGKISLDDVNKRLASKGLAPLPATVSDTKVSALSAPGIIDEPAPRGILAKARANAPINEKTAAEAMRSIIVAKRNSGIRLTSREDAAAAALGI